MAINHYTQAITIDPSNTAACNNRALTYLKMGNYRGCIKDADKVLVVEKDNGKVSGSSSSSSRRRRRSFL